MKKIDFAHNLKRYREAKGMNKQELGARIGVSDVTVGYWESGRNEPRMGKVEQIAEILEVSVDDLLFGNNANSDITQEIHNDNLSDEKKRGIELILSLSDEDVKMFNVLMERSLNKN